MNYRVKGKMHIWGWIDFKEAINATIVDYKSDGNYIFWIEFETISDTFRVENLLRQYDLKICNDYECKKEIKIDLLNEPMLFYKMPKDKQDALVKWINNNFIKIKTINKDKTSLKLKQLFCEFPINNGEFKGAMDKCGFKYHPIDGINWYFNISKKSPILLLK